MIHHPGKDKGSRVRVGMPESPFSLVLDHTGLTLNCGGVVVVVLMYIHIYSTCVLSDPTTWTSCR